MHYQPDHSGSASSVIRLKSFKPHALRLQFKKRSNVIAMESVSEPVTAPNDLADPLEAGSPPEPISMSEQPADPEQSSARKPRKTIIDVLREGGHLG